MRRLLFSSIYRSSSGEDVKGLTDPSLTYDLVLRRTLQGQAVRSPVTRVHKESNRVPVLSRLFVLFTYRQPATSRVYLRPELMRSS